VADRPAEGVMSEELNYVCKIDETEQQDDREFVLDKGPAATKVGALFADIFTSVAHCVIDSRESIALGLWPIILKKEVGKYLIWLAYACEHPGRGKRKVTMDVENMVQKWLPLVKALALAHDVDEKDVASATLDDLLKEVIVAPAKQIREFYRELTAALKKDKSVPWSLWKLFDFWGDNVLDKIKEEGMIVLRGDLAQQIAERSIEKIPVKDWVDSMIAALMWRSPERLEEIKSKLDEGHAPRVRGRESCLFLQVGDAEVML
jgi:hypothetical protein